MSWSEVKKVNSNLNTPLNEGGVKIVKSVQRGILKSTGSTFKYTININAINVNKSIIIVETALVTEDSADANSSASGTILSSTQIQIAVSNTPRSAFWQVVEFY